MFIVGNINQQFDGLNLGCHDIHIRGFLNVDIDPATNPQLCCNALEIEKFVTGQVHQIYCGHFLEHLSHEDGADLLQVCRRLLAPYGILTVVVPAWKKAMNMADIREIEKIVLNDGQHKRLFDMELLLHELETAGFPEIHEVNTMNLRHCLFPNEPFQISAIAINYPPVEFRGIEGNPIP